MAKYRCKVCGQIVEIPDGEKLECPICHAKGDNLVPYVEEEIIWPCEHSVGIAKGNDETMLADNYFQYLFDSYIAFSHK